VKLLILFCFQQLTKQNKASTRFYTLVLNQCSSHLSVIVEPLIYFRVCQGQTFFSHGQKIIPRLSWAKVSRLSLTKILKSELLVRRSNILLLDTSTNKQLLQLLKRKKFNDSVVLPFLECICYIQNLVIRQKELVSQICVVPFSNFGNWISFGPLRIRCLFYIWTILLITFHTFAVVVISLHIRKYAILLQTVSTLLPQRLNTAALVCYSVYSLLDLGCVYFLLCLLWTVHRQPRGTVMQQYRS